MSSVKQERMAGVLTASCMCMEEATLLSTVLECSVVVMGWVCFYGIWKVSSAVVKLQRSYWWEVRASVLCWLDLSNHLG